MPENPRKKVISAPQAESQSALEQNRHLTPELQVDPEPQQKVSEKEGFVLTDPKSLFVTYA
ncbi:MAG: hypothetical protein K0U98_27040 [Deltaproteobacteria bacterium]|nr:hypothetical protein [Deltaproteobacteria bacterium]